MGVSAPELGAERGPSEARCGERAACTPGPDVPTPTSVVRGAGPGICFIAQFPGGPWGRRIKARLGASRSTKGRPGLVQSPQTRERAQQGLGRARSRRGPVRRGHAPHLPAPQCAPPLRAPPRSHRPHVQHQACLAPGSASAGCENARALRGWPPLPAAAPPPGDSAPSTQEPISKATSSKKPSPDARTLPLTGGGFSLPQGPRWDSGLCPRPEARLGHRGGRVDVSADPARAVGLVVIIV